MTLLKRPTRHMAGLWRKEAEMADTKKDKWLDAFCPEEACLTQEERVALSKDGSGSKESVWKETFCPEDSCEINTPSQVP
jgi:hypothetical protein